MFKRMSVKMREQLTSKNVKQLLFAINVAQGEVGDEFEEVKAKLYELYPEVKAEHDQRERALHNEEERQTKLRKELIEDFLGGLDSEIHGKTYLEQLIEWYVANKQKVKEHTSDEICFAFDLWKYANQKLITKLAEECRNELRKDPNSDIYHTERPDNEMMHGLIRILENKSFA